MKCREKLKMDYPEYYIENSDCSHCIGCPSFYNYMDDPDYCPVCDNDFVDFKEDMEKLCEKCWNREIPEEVEGKKPDKGVDLTYRDKLVQLIKDSGQELIDRAEDMVGENLDAIASFTIYIDLPQDTDRVNYPSIEWTAKVINKKALYTKMEMEIRL